MPFLFKETVQCKPFFYFSMRASCYFNFRLKMSYQSWISRVTGANQSSRKYISVALVNIKVKYRYGFNLNDLTHPCHKVRVEAIHKMHEFKSQQKHFVHQLKVTRIPFIFFFCTFFILFITRVAFHLPPQTFNVCIKNKKDQAFVTRVEHVISVVLAQRPYQLSYEATAAESSHFSLGQAPVTPLTLNF